MQPIASVAGRGDQPPYHRDALTAITATNGPARPTARAVVWEPVYLGMLQGFIDNNPVTCTDKAVEAVAPTAAVGH